MNKYVIKLGTAISSAALIASSFITPVSAITIDIQNNGADSNNTVNYNQSSNTSVNQSNNATINTNVNVSQNTGNNTANKNNGGNVEINSGNASANVSVDNKANVNLANVNACCPGDVNVTVKDNAADSDNDVTLSLNNRTRVRQDNDANINSDVNVSQNTGRNQANKNNGGDVTITSGDADASVAVRNAVNWNGAVVSAGPNGGGTLTVEILHNGADSDNNVEINSSNNTTVNQDNDANIDSDINVSQNTGRNRANKNNGGEVTIDSGDAMANVMVNNLANLNWAEVDSCGCVFAEDSLVRIKDNAADSDNDATLNLRTKTKAVQDNDANLDTDVRNVTQNTGKNKANSNNGNNDPTITSGDADATVNVGNTVNKNILNGGDVEIPSWGGDHSGSDSFSAFFLWFLAHIS